MYLYCPGEGGGAIVEKVERVSLPLSLSLTLCLPKALWEPPLWLTPRFRGPFGSPFRVLCVWGHNHILPQAFCLSEWNGPCVNLDKKKYKLEATGEKDKKLMKNNNILRCWLMNGQYLGNKEYST